MPMTRPPIAGHHIQWNGSRPERVLGGVDQDGREEREQPGHDAGDDAEQVRRVA